jgi:hypothetical protein
MKNPSVGMEHGVSTQIISNAVSIDTRGRRPLFAISRTKRQRLVERDPPFDLKKEFALGNREFIYMRDASRSDGRLMTN